MAKLRPKINHPWLRLKLAIYRGQNYGRFYTQSASANFGSLHDDHKKHPPINQLVPSILHEVRKGQTQRWGQRAAVRRAASCFEKQLTSATTHDWLIITEKVRFSLVVDSLLLYNSHPLRHERIGVVDCSRAGVESRFLANFQRNLFCSSDSMTRFHENGIKLSRKLQVRLLIASSMSLLLYYKVSHLNSSYFLIYGRWRAFDVEKIDQVHQLGVDGHWIF